MNIKQAVKLKISHLVDLFLKQLVTFSRQTGSARSRGAKEGADL